MCIWRAGRFFYINCQFQKSIPALFFFNCFCFFCVDILLILSLYGQISPGNFDYFVGFISKICFGTSFVFFRLIGVISIDLPSSLWALSWAPWGVFWGAPAGIWVAPGVLWGAPGVLWGVPPPPRMLEFPLYFYSHVCI